ncbi:MAG: hypothetical protein R3C18_11185 [Planctomycetaceae bacterium]
MTNLRFVFGLVVLVGPTQQLAADQFSYGDKEPAGVHDERFEGKHCRVSVSGPTSGSCVKGRYDEPEGELRIAVDRLSHLTVSGRARKVVIMYVDLNCSVDLSQLEIGTGGVEIRSVSRRSNAKIGRCDGPVTIKSVDEGSAILLQPRTTVIGRNKFFGGSHLFFEK